MCSLSIELGSLCAENTHSSVQGFAPRLRHLQSLVAAKILQNRVHVCLSYCFLVAGRCIRACLIKLAKTKTANQSIRSSADSFGTAFSNNSRSVEVPSNTAAKRGPCGTACRRARCARQTALPKSAGYNLSAGKFK